MDSIETQTEGSEPCPLCGALIPLTNLQLHSLRCTTGRTEASCARSRERKRRGVVSTWCCSFVGVPLLVTLLIFGYFFVAWRREMQLYRARSNITTIMLGYPGLHIFIVDRVMGDTLRKVILDRTPQSYLPDVWPESYFAWTRVMDNFWSPPTSVGGGSVNVVTTTTTSTKLVKPPLKDRSHLVIEDAMLTKEQAKQLKQDLLSMTERLEILQWKALPLSRGVCGRRSQIRNGETLCAVHRWNAYHRDRKNRLMGRVQCWTDLLHSDAQFVSDNALFHPALVATTNNLFYCLVDVPGFASTLATPANSLLLHINNLLWYCDDVSVTDDPDDDNVKPSGLIIQPGDLPTNMVRRGLQPLFLQFLNAFINNDQGIAGKDDNDEGEIIDLDLLDESIHTENDEL